MSSDKVLMGVRRNDSVVKKMQSIQLKMKLIELENEYRQRLSSLVDTLKNAAAKSECLTHSRIRTIMKSMDEVLKGSDGLIVAFEKRGSSHQPADAVYEQINSHRLRCADGLFTYCAQLQDIYILLQESFEADKDKIPRNALHDALLPVRHVQEMLDIFQVVKKDLIDNKRLVEVFSCNALIEQLTKELETASKVIKSINADSLLVELRGLATKHNRGSTISSEAAPTAKQAEENPELPQLPPPHLEHTGKVPTSEMQPETVADQANPMTNSSLESSDPESSQKAVGDRAMIKLTRSSNIPLSRRESKKQVRYQVQSFASKLSEMKDELFLLQRRLEELNMLSVDSSSESDDQRPREDFPGSYEVESINYNGTNVKVEGVEVRKNSPLSRIKDNQTKALLRSSMRRAPLYQNYQKFRREAAASASVTRSSVEYEEMSGTVEDNVEVARPESGIVLEDGFHDDSVENIYCDDGDTSDYVNMNGTDFKKHTQNLRGEEYSNGPVPLPRYSLQVSTSDYASIIYPNYANMVMSPVSQEQSEIYRLTMQDDGCTNQNQMTLTDIEFPETVPTIMRRKSIRQRTRWCQIPLVKDSGVLEKMTSKQRNLQEAKYEIISSKVSYLKSLSIVQSVFIANEDLRQLMTPTEWNDLFQNIGPIKQCSEHFLSDLLSGWPQDIFLTNQLSVVRQYAESGLQVYVDFCSQKIAMDDTLKNIRANNPAANKALKKLELEEICDGHNLESFLVLPIQRITRFPLLVEGILQRMDSNNDKDFCDWAKTYHKLRMMAKRCNEAVQDAETRKINSKYMRSQSSTLPAKRNNLSEFWRDQSEISS